jgi:hypothetical protein
MAPSREFPGFYRYALPTNGSTNSCRGTGKIPHCPDRRQPARVGSLNAYTGHKTLQMLKRYTHLRAEDLAKLLG